MVSFGIHSDQNTLVVSAEHDAQTSSKTINIDPLFTTQQVDFDLIRDRCISAGGSPSENELGIINTARDAFEQDRQKYLAQVNELQALLVTAICSMRQSEIQIDLCNSLPAPIRRLPPETLCEIFGWYARMSEGDDINKAPFRIRGVCRYWRDIISSDNSSWSRLRINVMDHITTPEYLEMVKQRVSLYRSDSRTSSPLSLACFIAGFGSPSWEIFSLLIPHLMNCKRLYLGSDKFERGQQIIYVPSASDIPVLSKLEYLYLNFTNIYPVELWPRLLTHTPLLKEIEMIVWAGEQFTLLLSRPDGLGQQLKRLSTTIRVPGNRFYRPSPIHLWRGLVQNYPGLEALTVSIKSYTRRRRDLPPRILGSVTPTPDFSCPLPNLQRLTLNSSFAGDLMNFLQGFDLPSISYLSLDVVHPFRLVPKDQSLRDCMSNALSFFSNLVDLHLLRVCLSEDDLRAVLETCVRLEGLEIMNMDPKSQWYTYGPCIINNDPIVSLLPIHVDTDSDSQPDGLHAPHPLVPRLSRLHLFHNLISDDEHHSWAEQYADLFKSRMNWCSQQAMERKFSLRVTVSSYRRRGYNSKEECAAPEEDYDRFKAAVREQAYSSNHNGSNVAAHGAVTVEKAREPFQKRVHKWIVYSGDVAPTHINRETAWFDSIDPSYPAPL